MCGYVPHNVNQGGELHADSARTFLGQYVPLP
jgi:hypothetical protein